jgi:hypothetical protein
MKERQTDQKHTKLKVRLHYRAKPMLDEFARRVQGVPYVRVRFTTYISLNWLAISKSTLGMMYPYMWTTFTAKISAPGQPSSEHCNTQQIAPKTVLLTLTNFRKSRKKSNLKFPKITIK